ncbi:MAG: hypothetical protein IIZ20_09995 [Butyrivibrio sp.]|nr:hypothetical protein [Butyrivibrio sp.]
MKIGYSTKIMSDSILSRPVRRAVSALERDIRNTCLRSGEGFLDIVLKKRYVYQKKNLYLKKNIYKKNVLL